MNWFVKLHLIITHSVRHLERMPPVSGREGCPGCHPERSEGSRSPDAEILRCAQDDSPYLQMSIILSSEVTFFVKEGIFLLREI